MQKYCASDRSGLYSYCLTTYIPGTVAHQIEILEGSFEMQYRYK